MSAIDLVKTTRQSVREALQLYLMLGLLFLALVLWPAALYAACCILLFTETYTDNNDTPVLAILGFSIATIMCLVGAYAGPATLGLWYYLLLLPYLVGLIVLVCIAALIWLALSGNDPEEVDPMFG